MDEFLTVSAFAELIKMHPNSVRRAIKKGHIHAFRLSDSPKSALRIPRSELNRKAELMFYDLLEKSSLIDK